MVIVKLTGGLGNQMFQYAAGRALSFKLKTELKLDISNFNQNLVGHTLRNYQLESFNIKATIADSLIINKYKTSKPTLIDKIKRKCFNIPFKSSMSHIHEKSYAFDPQITYLKGDIYLDGFWQSWKYFSDVQQLIRNEFTLKYSLNEYSVNLFNKIKSCTSIGLHIRRGDYVLDPIANSYHGTCDLAYYYKCIDIIEKKIENPYYFIFSDDTDWVKSKFAIKNMHIVEYNENQHPHIDMFLMSICKHNIIANSTYSWWSAWLNQNSGKIVLSPTKWFTNKKINTKDLIPNNWIRV